MVGSIACLYHCAQDAFVVNAARVSFNTAATSKLSERDVGLIGFLMRNRHGTPFEHGYFQFLVEAPIFVLREWQRHRAGHSYNELSGRYTELDYSPYCPDGLRTQTGKPGAYSYEPLPEESAEQAHRLLDNAQGAAYSYYRRLLDLGVAKEQARAVLPVGAESKMYWSCNPRSLMHFLGLRNAADAQQEIRELAQEVEKHFQKVMPVTHAAFIENDRVAP